MKTLLRTRAQHRYRTACPPRSHHNSLSSPFNQHPRRSQSCNAVRCFAKTPVAPLGAAWLRLSAGEAVLRQWWR